MELQRLVLKPRREKPVLHGHPWIFEGALMNRPPCPPEGAVVEVIDSGGVWLGRGLLSSSADLAVRLVTRRADEQVNADLFRARVEAAWRRRERIWQREPDTRARANAWRLAHAEADGLPGLVVDLYADVLSLRVGCGAIRPWLPAIIEAFMAVSGARQAIVTGDADAAGREALDARALSAMGTASEARVEILENRLRFNVDCGAGQKTGYFIDQRDNRARVAAYARGASILSAYCYTGAFEVVAAAAGAREILALDRSESALARAVEHHRLNNLTVPVKTRRGEAPEVMRRLRDEARSFDLVILDPPRFVGSEAQREAGLRAYKDINLLGIKLLRPGGILATFSCSGLVSAADFRRAVAYAASDAGRPVRVLETLTQPPDHPVPLAFPEAGYLKGLIAEVE